MRIVLVTLIAAVLVSCHCSGQSTKTVASVKGEWVISDDITPTQARENALAEAKVEALRIAGVPEYVAASNVLFAVENDRRGNDVFESLTTVEISGDIASYSIVKERKGTNEVGNLVYEVWIDATVTIHSTPRDRSFDVSIKGIREFYLSPDKLTFQITPSKDGFLTTFVVSESESSVLFPNMLERQEVLEAGVTHTFPRSTSLDYEVSAEGEVEINYFLFLFTKHRYPFSEPARLDNILRFIANIPPDEKCLKTYSVVIKR